MIITLQQKLILVRVIFSVSGGFNPPLSVLFTVFLSPSTSRVVITSGFQNLATVKGLQNPTTVKDFENPCYCHGFPKPLLLPRVSKPLLLLPGVSKTPTTFSKF